MSFLYQARAVRCFRSGLLSLVVAVLLVGCAADSGNETQEPTSPEPPVNRPPLEPAGQQPVLEAAPTTEITLPSPVAPGEVLYLPTRQPAGVTAATPEAASSAATPTPRAADAGRSVDAGEAATREPVVVAELTPVVPTESALDALSLTPPGPAGQLAAEPVGIAAWINTPPLTLEELRGKVVLVDFWTYTCINCIRTFPYLKLWHSRYVDDGLVILGIHTPEFEFEKNLENVLQATRENGVVWPVAQDNDYQTWRAYSNRFWPAKYLIDHRGVIRYTHFGEGKYAETEAEIQELLLEAGAEPFTYPELPGDQQLDPAYLSARTAEVTRELYAGYRRNVNAVYSGRHPYVIQQSYYDGLDTVVNLAAPEELTPHYIFLNGPWLVGPESVRHGHVSRDYSDYIALRYSAKSVNAVLTSQSGRAYQVRVTLDGEYLTPQNKGADVGIGPNGESYLVVDQPRLYEIVNSPAYTQGQTLRLSSNSADFGLFAFTFGVYQEGP